MEPKMEEAYQVYRLYESLRGDLMDGLSDDDLQFSPGGASETLGELCVEIGEIQTSYILSFQTFTQNFGYRIDQEGLDRSVPDLVEWYQGLDQELYKVVDQLSAEDVETRTIDRGNNFQISPRGQLDIYKEALLIFYGKVSVYIKAMERPRPSSWVDWIG